MSTLRPAHHRGDLIGLFLQDLEIVSGDEEAYRRVEPLIALSIAAVAIENLLTDELKQKILDADTMTVLEDVYLPFRPKRRTRGTIAREKGLEPLAERLLAGRARVELR